MLNKLFESESYIYRYLSHAIKRAFKISTGTRMPYIKEM